MQIGFEGPFCRSCGAQGVARGGGGPASGPRAGGVATHRAGGARAALRLHYMPPGVEAGHLGPGPAAGAADPRGPSSERNWAVACRSFMFTIG